MYKAGNTITVDNILYRILWVSRDNKHILFKEPE